MKKSTTWDFLSTVSLFHGIAPDEIGTMLSCLGAEQKDYKKNQYLFHGGDKLSKVGVVLKGRVQLIQEDYNGNRHILAEIVTGELFAEAFACVDAVLPFAIEAVEESEILFLNYERVVTSCTSACMFHQSLIKNMLTVLAKKNIALTMKLKHVTKRSTREKLLSYLWEQSKTGGSLEFEISFDRQQLADYLCVERSAMSSELGKLKAEGILDYKKNKFCFLKN